MKFEYGVPSLTVGYTYVHKGSDSVTAQNSTLFEGEVINSDPMLKGWSTHTLSIGAELDFTNNENDKKLHPKVGIAYNHILRAQQAFLNHTVSGSLGLTIAFDV